MSEYSMQIVRRKDGAVLSWTPGANVEVDIAVDLCRRLKGRAITPRTLLVDLLCERIKAYGVGVFTTEKTVIDTVKKEFERLILEDKLVPESEILEAIGEEFAGLIHDLKRKV